MSPDRPLERPSLYRFTFEMPTLPIRCVCVLTGVGAAVIVGTTARGRWRGLLVRAAATTVGAVLVALLISVVHIPSGH